MSKKCKDTYKNLECDVIGDPAVKEDRINLEKIVKVSIRWSDQISIKKQLILLLKIYPLHNYKSRQEMLNEIQINNNEWSFGEFTLWKAIDIKEEGSKRGLTILIYD